MAESRSNMSEDQRVKELAAIVQSKLKGINEAYAAVKDRGGDVKVELCKEVEEQLKGTGVEVSLLGGGNNINLCIKNKDKNASIVLQCSKSVDGVAGVALARQVALNLDNSKWMSKVYAESKVKGYGDEIYSVKLMEMASSSFENEVSKLNEKAKPENSIRFAIDIGIQLANMYGDMTKKDVSWLDMKPGNILINSDGQAVIADTKAFIPLNDRSLLENESIDRIRKNGTLIFNDLTTPAFLPKSLADQDRNIKFDEFPEKIQKEYSYQMAAMLYLAVTGEKNDPQSSVDNYYARHFACDSGDKIDVFGENDKGETLFDRYPKLFGNDQPAGLMLKKLIQGLGKADPKERMDIERLPGYLNILKQKMSENRYNEGMKNLKEKIPKSGWEIKKSQNATAAAAIDTSSSSVKNNINEKSSSAGPRPRS